jgi:hypothetical protein
MPKQLEESPILSALNLYFEDRRQLAEIGKLAVRLFDCQCEFGGETGCCSEWQQTLDSAILRYKEFQAEPLPGTYVQDSETVERATKRAWEGIAKDSCYIRCYHSDGTNYIHDMYQSKEEAQKVADELNQQQQSLTLIAEVYRRRYVVETGGCAQEGERALAIPRIYEINEKRVRRLPCPLET